jgi:calcineurin-like phosphoesterase family protein
MLQETNGTTLKAEKKETKFLKENFTVVEFNSTTSFFYFLNLFKIESKNIFLNALHLDHTNIIRFCKRPFKNTEKMNRILVNNWNRLVRPQDIVYYLGDISVGRNSRKADYWLNKLNGKIIFIKGNHYRDKSNKIKLLENTILEYKNKKFFLVHDPKDAPNDWKDWVICGHHHNNKPKDCPFINGKKKQINVSVEMINYPPLDIDKLFELEFEKINFMETINSKL